MLLDGRIELETRNTFTRMLKEKIGLQDPIFYEEYAAFEHNNGVYSP